MSQSKAKELRQAAKKARKEFLQKEVEEPRITPGPLGVDVQDGIKVKATPGPYSP